MQAGLFAVPGTVLATFGHHAIAETAVPWRLVTTVCAVQFVAVWPLARRCYDATATVAFMLAMQSMLHLDLSYAEGDARPGCRHTRCTQDTLSTPPVTGTPGITPGRR